MLNVKQLTVCISLLATMIGGALGATNGVVLGQDFQSVINASSPGDTLIVQPGVYADSNLVFNKALSVLPSGTNGNPIQFLGTIQLAGLGVSSLQRAYFANTVQTVGATVSFFEAVFNSNVNVTGGKVTMKRTTLNSPLTLSSNVAFEALRMTNNATITATASAGSGTPFLAVQSSFSDLVDLTGYKALLGYNNCSGSGRFQLKTCDSVLVGNKITGSVACVAWQGIYAEAGSIKAYNNLIRPMLCGGYQTVNGIWLRSITADLVNNTVSIDPAYGSGQVGGAGTSAIYASDGGQITLRGNIAIGSGYAQTYSVQGAGLGGQSLFGSYCSLWNLNLAVVSGIVPPLVNCIFADPNLAGDGSPNPGSPCINAGPPEPIYNNRDSTRNTMGYTGGPYWNPANYTNNNPIVFFLTGQQTVLSGVQTNIQINAAASAGH